MIKKVGWDKKLAKEWGKYKPPSRPSSGEIRIYESYIRELPRKSKILIMGSTPELRDLTAKYKIDTTICDWSEDVYRALKLLVKHKAKETFIRGDWREMNFGEKFDMIIGDCSTTVVPYKDLDTVISNVSRNLVPNGLAIQRIWVRHKKEKYSVSKIVKIFNYYILVLFLEKNKAITSIYQLPYFFRTRIIPELNDGNRDVIFSMIFIGNGTSFASSVGDPIVLITSNPSLLSQNYLPERLSS